MRDTLSLYRLAEEAGIEVDWLPMKRAQSLSMPLGKRYAIAMDPRKIISSADERVKLSHELGHCATGSFYNRYAARDLCRRHELHADRWAIRQLIPREELQGALDQGLTQPWELAEHFDVTEGFLKKALAYYSLLDEEDL